MDFTKKQLEEIKKGKTMLSESQIAIYAKPEYNWEQMYELRRGLEAGLDVSIYANPKFNQWKMEEIRLALHDKLTIEQIKIFAKTWFSAGQMRVIRSGIKKGLNVLLYAKENYTQAEMCDIYEYLLKRKEAGLDEC